MSSEALQSLLLREQHRQQALYREINSSAIAQKECLQMAGEDFVTSLASLTEQLLALLDLLVTADEVKTASQHSENTDDTALRPHTGKRTWKGIPYFASSVVTKATTPITTNKCTRGHELVILERDVTFKRFREMYRGELMRLDSDKHKKLGEVEKWNEHWSHQLDTLTHTLN
ncbi:hypothetical protein NL108_004872 [Boleophthalmus pectinirostris]|nr:hypothetical protein NL108_004872 [Boleophthalmus pectinirostris]